MKIYKSCEIISTGKTVAALGNFDGLHKAHMVIMNEAKSYAKQNGMEAGALIFDKFPAELLGKPFKRIMTLEDKINLLSFMDFVYVEEISREFLAMSGEGFARFLSERLNVGAVCAGYNFRFGKGAECDIACLRKFGQKYGFEVIEAAEYKENGKTVSSTLIREMVEKGEMREAAKLLNRPFFMSGFVGGGYRVGRTIGFPTVNLKYDKNSVLPRRGVYAGYVKTENNAYKAVINVGKRPTFGEHETTIEGFILDFDGDLYDKKIKIYFMNFLREEVKFENAERLSEQIERDVNKAREILGNEEI